MEAIEKRNSLKKILEMEIRICLWLPSINAKLEALNAA